MNARRKHQQETVQQTETGFEPMDWHGQKILKNHCFDIPVDEIVTLAGTSDSIRIGLVGQSHAGKTTMFDALSHSIREHARKKIGLEFVIRKFTKEELVEFKDTVESLPNANLILLFDDVSFLNNLITKKQLAEIKSAVTEIRHLSGRADKKIISVFNSHYSLAVDKFVRNYDFQFQLTAGTTEYDNLEHAFGPVYGPLIRAFDKHRRTAMKKKYYDVKLGGEVVHRYKWRDPFITALFWNQDTLRLIASPTHKFLAPDCNCTETKAPLKNQDYLSAFVDDMVKKYPKLILQSIKPILYARGHTEIYNRAILDIQKMVLAENLSTEDLLYMHDEIQKINKQRVISKWPDLTGKEDVPLEPETNDSD